MSWTKTSIFSVVTALLSLPLCTALYGQEIKHNICVFEAPLDMPIAQLEQLRAPKNCLSPVPNIFEVGTEGRRLLWWHFGQLQNNSVLLNNFTLSLSDFIFRRGVLHLRYVDDETKTVSFSPNNSAVYKTPFRQFKFPYPGRQVAVQEVYLGLDLSYDPSLVNIIIAADEEVPNKGFSYWLFVGLVLGIQLAMLLYNLVLAARFRFSFHIAYCCLGAVALCYNFFLLDGDILLFSAANSNLVLYFEYISVGFLLFFSVFFIVSFLETWALSSWARNTALLIASTGLVIAIFSFLMTFSAYPSWAYNAYTMGGFNLAVALITIIIVYIIYASIRNGSRAGIFLLLAWTPMIMATIYRLAASLGYIGFSEQIDLVIPVASSLEMVILSLGIVDRLNSIRIERDRVTEANKRLLVVAQTDPLTGAGNRRYLTTRFQQIETSEEYINASLALILFDIDYFKHINDTWGHDAGDTVLVELVKQVKQISRSHEIFARIGGEEFALLLPGADKATAEAMAQRVRLAIANIARSRIAPVDQVVTVSLGVATIKVNSTGYHDLYRRADKALYAAKDAGRNCVLAFDDLNLSV